MEITFFFRTRIGAFKLILEQQSTKSIFISMSVGCLMRRASQVEIIKNTVEPL